MVLPSTVSVFQALSQPQAKGRFQATRSHLPTERWKACGCLRRTEAPACLCYRDIYQDYQAPLQSHCNPGVFRKIKAGYFYSQALRML